MLERERFAPIDLIVLQRDIHKNCIKSPAMSKYFEDFAVDFLHKFDPRVEIVSFRDYELHQRFHVKALVNGEELASVTVNYQDELMAEHSRDLLSNFLLTLTASHQQISAMIDRQLLQQRHADVIVREPVLEAL